MSYEVLEREIKTLPVEYLDSISEYVALLKYKVTFLNQNKQQDSQKKVPILGLAEGKYKIPDDINAFDDEISGMFGEDL